jgi:hypothetical protein
MEFSYFPNGIKQTVPASTYTIDEFLSHIQGGFWAKQIQALRQETATEKTKKLKASLPHVTLSGVFAKRDIAHLTTHSGLMQVDIDKLGEEQKSYLKKQLANDEYVLACFDSPTNTGLKCIFVIDADKDLHAQNFAYIEHYFMSKYGIAIDNKCKDVSRAMFVSYDAEMHANANAKKFDFVPTETLNFEKLHHEYTNGVANQKQGKGEYFDNVFQLCENWVGKKYSFVDGQKAYYIFALACLLCEFGISENEALAYIYQTYPRVQGDKNVTQFVGSAYKKCEFGKRKFNEPKAKKQPKAKNKNTHRDSQDTETEEAESSWEQDLPEDLAQEEKSSFYNYGFYQYKNCLYFAERGRRLEKIANFTIKILFLIRSKTAPKRIVELRNEFGVSTVLDLPIEALINVSKFNTYTQSEGNFLFEGKELHLNKLKRKLMLDEKSAKEIETLGHQREGDFWAWANGIYAGGQYIEADTYGIVSYKSQNYFLPALSKIYQYDDVSFENEKKFIYKKSKLTFAEWATKFCQVYKEEQNGRIGVLYYIAALFRDIIQREKQFFPILNMFGVPQTGKTSFASSLLYMFGEKQEAFMLGNAGTVKGFMRKFGQLRNALAWLDEYKNNLNLKTIEAIKNLWDGVGYERAKMTQDNRTQTTPIYSACLLSGQELPTADSALTSRCVMTIFKKTNFDEKEQNEFNELKNAQLEGLSAITHEVIKHRETFAQKFVTTFKRSFDDLQASCKADDRILSNHAVLLTAFRIMQNELSLPFTDAQIFSQLKGMINQTTALMGLANDVRKFWDTVEYLYAKGDIKEHEDFVIREGKLCIRLTKIYPLYMEAFSKQFGLRGMDKTSLIQYLKASPAFDQFKESMRIGSAVTSAFLFNLDILKVRIGEYEGTDEEQQASTDELQKTNDLPPWE